MTLVGSSFQMPLVFAGKIALASEGIVMCAIFAYVEGRMTR